MTSSALLPVKHSGRISTEEFGLELTLIGSRTGCSWYEADMLAGVQSPGVRVLAGDELSDVCEAVHQLTELVPGGAQMQLPAIDSHGSVALMQFVEV